MWKRIRRVLGFIVSAWVLLTFAMFFSAAVVSTFGSPKWLELPWSDIQDFIATSDGKVFVSSNFYRRILVYDATGGFVESHQYPYGKRGQLAVDDFDNIYFWSNKDVYVYDRNWMQTQIIKESDYNCDCNSWSFVGSQKLVCEAETTFSQRTIEPVKTGKCYFLTMRKKRLLSLIKTAQTFIAAGSQLQNTQKPVLFWLNTERLGI